MSLRIRMILLVGLFLGLLMGIGAWGVVSTLGMQNRMLAEQERKSDAELADWEAMELENERLKAETARLKTRLSLEGDAPRSDRNEAEKAMARHVAKCTKQHLFKRCKFIKNERKLIKATRWVIVWFSVR